MRQLEVEFLGYEVGDLVIICGHALYHGDDLLDEHVAEQHHQGDHDDSDTDQTDRGGRAALPTVANQPDHQRFDGERDKHRHHNIKDDGVDFSPRIPHKYGEEHSNDSIEEAASPPFWRAPGVTLLREDRGKIDLRFLLLAHGSPFYIGDTKRRQLSASVASGAGAAL